MISKLKKQSRSQLHSLANMGNDYSDGFKIQAQNAGLTNHYVNQLNQQSPQDYSSLQCQLEDRYGKTRKTAGQAFYWGGQAAMLVATGGASIWVQGLANAAKAGAMAVNSARIMSALRIPNASVARGATTMTTGTDSAAGTTAAATAGAATEATLGAASSSTSGAASSTAVRTAASSNLATAGAVASLDVMNAYISDCVGSNTVDSFRQNICKNLNGDTTELLKKDLDTSNCALGITLSALGTAASPLVKAFKRQRQLGLASKSKSGRTDTWPGMSTGERIIMNRILNRNVDSYNEALQAGHAQTRFLQELGFQITPNRINAPDISTALNGVDDKIDELIAAGKIKEDEVLRPVVPYETPNGSIVFARPGTELPEGSTHLTRLLTREQMAYLIERGYFPVGAPNHVVDGGTPALVHDLGHFGAFIDNPDVMASMRRNYSEALNAQGTALELQNIQYRHAYIMENLVLSTPERVNGLNGILRNNGSSLRLGNDEDFIQLSTIQRSVDQMSPEQVDTAIRQITERPASELRFIGGGTRDVRWVYDQANSSAEAGIRSIEEYESVFRNPNFGLRNDIDERREALANYLYISEHTRNLSTRDLYRGINNSGPVDQSPFRQLVCSDSGYSTTLFGIFC
ncbi:MAG: hypothetical protein CL677_10035 [Bdellovibrionaceae bacterium]|nr:hypothetical protein [Pseudobdellovibrionaceae bacterium]